MLSIRKMLLPLLLFTLDIALDCTVETFKDIDFKQLTIHVGFPYIRKYLTQSTDGYKVAEGEDGPFSEFCRTFIKEQLPKILLRKVNVMEISIRFPYDKEFSSADYLKQIPSFLYPLFACQSRIKSNDDIDVATILAEHFSGDSSLHKFSLNKIHLINNVFVY